MRSVKSLMVDMDKEGVSKEDLNVLLPTSELDVGWDVCGECPAERCSERKECLLCRRCRTPEQAAALRQMVAEGRAGEGFKRLIPLGPAASSRLVPPRDTPTNNLLAQWLRHQCEEGDNRWC